VDARAVLSSILSVVVFVAAPTDADAEPATQIGPVTPFGPTSPPVPAPPLPAEGVSPLESGNDAGTAPATAKEPFGRGPPRPRVDALVPKATLMTRLDVMVGMIWRTQQLDTILGTNLEVGQMHGFSGTFHTELIIATQREVVSALDVPIGLGAVARGRLRNRPLYGSVGLSAGILVHRAGTGGNVLHRVDPDLRLPIRFAWTIATIGISVAVVQGYSFRRRTYESRGAIVWERDAYRVGVMLGLHWDKVVGRIERRERGRPRKSTPRKDGSG
jgi:hypothetical protein